MVDDEEFVRESLCDLLDDEGYTVLQAEGPPGALELFQRSAVDAIVTDLSMPDGTGQELLERVRQLDPEVPVILLTGVGTVKDAVEAMKCGATDFVQKPVDPERFFVLVERALEHRDLRREVERLRHAVQRLRRPAKMVGASPWFHEIRGIIERVAASDVPVLITGESGTGKELLATEIHRASPRAEAPLVRVNCAALTEERFDLELFGRRDEAGDQLGRIPEAEAGTLLLDEVGTLRSELQARLLAVLETGEFQVIGETRPRVTDARVMAITNENLEERVEAGDFRSDLYYRLCGFPLVVPPLRDRVEDIETIARYFLRTLAADGDEGGRGLTEAAVAALAAYPWKGNARELRNVIERALILQPRGDLDVVHLPGIGAQPKRTQVTIGDDEDLNLKSRGEALERELILAAMRRTEGVKRDAAKLLGIDPKNFGYYLRKHDIVS